MKFLTFINILININFNIIFDFPIYKYQEMKEVRYIFFYNIDEFNLNDIEIYVADDVVNYSYEFNNYYKIDLENYYPLDSIKIKNNNLTSFSLKISNNDDFNADSFAYYNILNSEKIIDINSFIIDNPKWYQPKYMNKKCEIKKTIKCL